MKAMTVTLACVAAATLVAGAAPASHRAAFPCPRGALLFGPNPIAPAATTAVAREARSRPQVVSAVIASGDAGGRGGMVKRSCGSAAAARTVVVSITLRRFLPSASLSQRVSFVSHFRSGWRVWYVAH
jgi:hypothetical protein